LKYQIKIQRNKKRVVKSNLLRLTSIVRAKNVIFYEQTLDYFKMAWIFGDIANTKNNNKKKTKKKKKSEIESAILHLGKFKNNRTSLKS